MELLKLTLIEETTNQRISTGTPMDNYVDAVSFQLRDKNQN